MAEEKSCVDFALWGGLTPGNLDSHAKRLAEEGLLEARKVLTKEGFEARYRINPAGLAAMEAYLRWLEEYAAGLRAGRSPG